MNVEHKADRWKGFLIESKQFMSYGKMTRKERVKFWVRVPFVWLKFVWALRRDEIRRIVFEGRQSDRP